MVRLLNCIVAVSQNMGIGKNGDLPWPLLSPSPGEPENRCHPSPTSPEKSPQMSPQPGESQGLTLPSSPQELRFPDLTWW
ncbi:dihydrofolate reductase-like [Sagmatias obliquidens]|uniref:dihydrofolate reductase-like n=1 Tax=Sagmatias obliquidens TaxID=3371155 RepID=UPI000F43E6A7|nr:dihydrofolate reductase-like [Lagenorhynchus obliquidens]